MSKDYLWTERYRPSTIDDVIIPDTVKEQFKAFIAQGQIPNLILTSPSPGTGKTTTALALCRELGIEKPLFINASMNNSIEDIRMTVTQYATTMSMFGDSNHKVVILDEAERLSPAAQDSLKGLIEQVHSNCRFILTANTKSRIIEPLLSRGVNIDFMFTKDDEVKMQAKMFKRCIEILDENGVTHDKKVIAPLVKKFFPDNRRLLNFLQKESATGAIDAGTLAKASTTDTSALIEAMKTKKYGDVKNICFDMADRWGDDFYSILFKSLENQVTDQSVPEIVLVLGDYQRSHSIVPDRFIHYLTICTVIMMNVKFK